MKVAVIHGPNLNLLGIREPHIYGSDKLEDINADLQKFAKASQLDIELEFFQSNLEGEIIDKIQECMGEVDGLIINPAAYSHTSIAIKDALSALSVPVIEVHMSNVHAREEYRHNLMTAKSAHAIVAGLGAFSYHTALIGMHRILLSVKANQD